MNKKNIIKLYKISDQNRMKSNISLDSEKMNKVARNNIRMPSMKQKNNQLRELKTKRNNELIRDDFKDKISSRVNFNKNMKNQYNKVLSKIILELNQKKNLILLLQKESATLNPETLQKTIKNLGLEFNVSNVAKKYIIKIVIYHIFLEIRIRKKN